MISLLLFAFVCEIFAVFVKNNGEASPKGHLFELTRLERTIEQNKQFFTNLRSRKAGNLPPRKHRLAFLGNPENALKKSVPTVPMINLDDEAYIGTSSFLFSVLQN